MADNYYKHGDYNAICDVCGFKFKFSELKARWDGLYVCKEDFEVRHPMDLFRPELDEEQPEILRSEPADQFVPDACPTCTIEMRSACAGVGVAGCMVAGMKPVLC